MPERNVERQQIASLEMSMPVTRDEADALISSLLGHVTFTTRKLLRLSSPSDDRDPDAAVDSSYEDPAAPPVNGDTGSPREGASA